MRWATSGSRVLHTPGHTPDGVCLVVTDRTRAPEPWFVLTGDTLFSGGVGRPDLLGARRRDAARRAALRQPLRQAPHAPRSPRGVPGALRRRGLRQGPQRQARIRRSASSDGSTRRSSSRRRPSSSASCWPICRPSPRRSPRTAARISARCEPAPARASGRTSRSSPWSSCSTPSWARWSASSGRCSRCSASRSSGSRRRPRSPRSS